MLERVFRYVTRLGIKVPYQQCILMASAPWRTVPNAIPGWEVQERHLDNGAVLVTGRRVAPLRCDDVACIIGNVIIDRGYCLSKALEGMPHVIEHGIYALRAGGRYHDLWTSSDHGRDANATTTLERVEAHCTCHRDDVIAVYDMNVNHMTNESFEDIDWATLERELGPVSDEMRKNDTNVYNVLLRKINTLLGSGTPLSMSTIGTLTSLRNIDKHAVTAWLHANNQPCNRVSYVFGNFGDAAYDALQRHMVERIGAMRNTNDRGTRNPRFAMGNSTQITLTQSPKPLTIYGWRLPGTNDPSTSFVEHAALDAIGRILHPDNVLAPAPPPFTPSYTRSKHISTLNVFMGTGPKSSPEMIQHLVSSEAGISRGIQDSLLNYDRASELDNVKAAMLEEIAAKLGSLNGIAEIVADSAGLGSWKRFIQERNAIRALTPTHIRAAVAKHLCTDAHVLMGTVQHLRETSQPIEQLARTMPLDEAGPVAPPSALPFPGPGESLRSWIREFDRANGTVHANCTIYMPYAFWNGAIAKAALRHDKVALQTHHCTAEVEHSPTCATLKLTMPIGSVQGVVPLLNASLNQQYSESVLLDCMQEIVGDAVGSSSDFGKTMKRAFAQCLYDIHHPRYIYSGEDICIHAADARPEHVVVDPAVKWVVTCPRGYGRAVEDALRTFRFDPSIDRIQLLRGRRIDPTEGEAPHPTDMPAESGFHKAVVAPGAAASAVLMTMSTPPVQRHDAKWWTHGLASRILGGGFEGKLIQNVRIKKGLSYGSYAAFTGDNVKVQTTTAPKDLAACRDAVLDVLSRWKRGDYFDEESIQKALRVWQGEVDIGKGNEKATRKGMTRLQQWGQPHDMMDRLFTMHGPNGEVVDVTPGDMAEALREAVGEMGPMQVIVVGNQSVIDAIPASTTTSHDP